MFPLIPLLIVSAFGLYSCAQNNLPAAKNLPASEEDEEPAAPSAAPSAAPPIITPPVNPPSVTGALINWAPELDHEMDADDPANWQKASWSNNGVFANTWQRDNISFNDGIMTVTLDNKGCPQTCDGKPYASGEYRTAQEKYGFGYYEARLKGAAGNGLIGGSFYTYCGTYGKPNHHEIDMEILGKNCQLQTNYYASGIGGHEEMIDLDFDACADFHNYGFRWAQDSIVFYVDGKPVRTVTSTGPNSLPSRPGKIMANFWAGTSEENAWLSGPFKYSAPLTVQYDWIKYSSLEAGQQPTATAAAPEPAAQSAPAAPTAPVNPLPDGKVTESEGAYSFGIEAASPRFNILIENTDVSQKKALKFDIKGSLTKLGGDARLAVQVYGDKDDDSHPSISFDPVSLSGKFSPVSVYLGGMKQVKNVQFLLVTDKGSCAVEIRNLRFE